MLNRKESKMLGMQRESAKLASIVSVAILATSALSASADGRPAPESAANKQFASTWQRHTASRSPRYFGFARPGSVFSPAKNVPDDGCDLPSTGCPNYLAN